MAYVVDKTILLRSKVFYDKKYLPWQPGFENFSLKYQNYIVQSNDLLYELVSDFYEITSNDFKTSTIPTIPDGCTDLMFTFDGNTVHAYVSAGVKSIQKFYFGDVQYLFGVRFMPGKTYSIFHNSMKELVNNPIPLEEILKDGNNLKEYFSLTQNFEQRIHLLRKYILLHQILPGTKELILNNCLHTIFTSKGNISIKDLSDQSLYSPRYLHKILTEYVGVSTKNLCEIIRQQYAAFLLKRNGQISLTDLAATCEYEDINHMNKMFKKYMGCNPSALRMQVTFAKKDVNESICFRR